MNLKQPAVEPTPTINDLPLKAKQRRDLTDLLGEYNRVKGQIADLENAAKAMQANIKMVVENLGVDKFTADTNTGRVSVSYYPQVREAIDRMELIKQGVDASVIDASTKRTEFFVLKVTQVRG
jgi:hypothetical protein